VQTALEQLHRGKFGEVFADTDGSGIELEKFHLLGIGGGTEDQADGRFLPRGAFVSVQPAVEITGERVLDGEKLHEAIPTQLCRPRRHNPCVREKLRELDGTIDVGNGAMRCGTRGHSPPCGLRSRRHRSHLDGLSTTHAERLKTLMTLNFQQFEDISLMAA